MEFFSHRTKIDFMANSQKAFIFSGILFVLSLTGISFKGLNMGLDFTGGMQVEAHYSQPAQLNHIRRDMRQHGFDHATLQAYGTANDVLIRVAPRAHVKQQILKQQVAKALPAADIRRVEYIGPQVGKTLLTNGILAILVAMLATMTYIALRFEYRFAVSAAVSLIHDPILILGIFAWWQLEFNLISLAALLTILGYSLNDTVVVYDRVRENFRKHRKLKPAEVVNLAINQTLSRTIMTSGLTLLVVLALFLFGGPTLQGFSLALIIGIVIGTYSSIYVAGALSVVMGMDREALMPKPKAMLDDTP